MGGRVGEEMAFGQENVTTGAGDDFRVSSSKMHTRLVLTQDPSLSSIILQKATSIAENMVSRFGLSTKLGPRVLSGSMQEGAQLSPTTRETIDNEVNDLLNGSLTRARDVLTKHKQEHQALAEALLYFETLTAEQVKQILEGKLKTPKNRPTVANTAASPKTLPTSSKGIPAATGASGNIET